MKAAGSGRELGADRCHSFRATPDLRGRGGKGGQTDGLSLSAPSGVGRGRADAPLLFWEVDSSKEFIHKGGSGGGGGSGTSGTVCLQLKQGFWILLKEQNQQLTMDQMIMCKVKGGLCSSPRLYGAIWFWFTAFLCTSLKMTLKIKCFLFLIPSGYRHDPGLLWEGALWGLLMQSQI